MNTSKQTTSSNEEDIELFQRYQATKVLDDNGKILATDRNLRNDLAERNARLVTFVINKFYSKKPHSHFKIKFKDSSNLVKHNNLKTLK